VEESVIHDASFNLFTHAISFANHRNRPMGPSGPAFSTIVHSRGNASSMPPAVSLWCPSKPAYYRIALFIFSVFSSFSYKIPPKTAEIYAALVGCHLAQKALKLQRIGGVLLLITKTNPPVDALY
jgi:hypothetical protein